MSSILTNNSAMVALQTLKSINSDLSKTQSMIAKSSGESELFGVIMGSSEALGFVTLAGDFGHLLRTRVHVDATAAKGMIERQGISRVRHIEVDNV